MESTNVYARDYIKTVPEFLNARTKSYYAKHNYYTAIARLAYWNKVIKEKGSLTPKQQVRYMAAKMNLEKNQLTDPYSGLRKPKELEIEN